MLFDIIAVNCCKAQKYKIVKSLYQCGFNGYKKR